MRHTGCCSSPCVRFLHVYVSFFGLFLFSLPCSCRYPRRLSQRYWHHYRSRAWRLFPRRPRSPTAASCADPSEAHQGCVVLRSSESCQNANVLPLTRHIIQYNQINYIGLIVYMAFMHTSLKARVFGPSNKPHQCPNPLS